MTHERFIHYPKKSVMFIMCHNYHPLLLGMILERSTGMSVSEYLRTKVWEKVGAQSDASRGVLIAKNLDLKRWRAA